MKSYDRVRAGLLLDLYGPMLTAHQYEVWRLYFLEDWSLAEIGEAEHVSRAAVHDLLERTGRLLEHYESRLGLLTRSERRRAQLREVLYWLDGASDQQDVLKRVRDTLGQWAEEEDLGNV